MLHVLPCLDDEFRADRHRTNLDIPQRIAAELGRSAVEAIRVGSYQGPAGPVDWRAEVERTVSLRQSIRPDAALPPAPGRRFPRTEVQVTNETTLEAGRRLVDRGFRPLALNFANGISPGGGFLHGARAQEEALCRSSALYATLVDDPMYAAHYFRPLPDSTDWCLISREVPVFRDDAGNPLPRPWLLDFLTCAAPYAPAVGSDASARLLRARIGRILAVAHAYGWTSLVLGAWGCGAFRNDPTTTARDFRDALEGPFDGCFETVVFAITDWSPGRSFLGPFRDVFR